MRSVAHQLMVLGFMILPAASLVGQSLSVHVGVGENYLLASDWWQKENIWRNSNIGFPVLCQLEYRRGHAWASLGMEGGRYRWAAGPGTPIWPGRNRPIQLEQSWWGLLGSLTAGLRYGVGFRDRIEVSPYLGAAWDWHQEVSGCSAGSTLGQDLQVPVAHAHMETQVSSSLLLGGGMHFDVPLEAASQPIWLRLGVGAWWRESGLLAGSYEWWDNGGSMQQQPPWGVGGPRPGQRIKAPLCPPLSVEPDHHLPISLPGAQLKWTIGIRFDLLAR